MSKFFHEGMDLEEKFLRFNSWHAREALVRQLHAREAMLEQMAEALRVALDCASYGAVLEDADVWDDVRSVLTAYEGSK